MRLNKARLGAFVLLLILASLAWGLVNIRSLTGAASGDLTSDDPTASDTPAQGASKPALGIVTSLPIYWPEASDLEDMLAQQDNVPWVRAQLEREYDLVPLDALSGENVGVPSPQLAGLTYLLIAQPAAMAPEELVALDAWVRAGGQLLLLADPMLTQESDFAHGDRRRPADMAMLDPLLARWGLSMQYDPAQRNEERLVKVGDNPQFGMPLNIPVHLAGTLRLISDMNPKSGGETSSDRDSACGFGADGLIALCKIGTGEALIVADAAVLELPEPPVESHMVVPEEQESGSVDSERSAALTALLDWAFR